MSVTITRSRAFAKIKVKAIFHQLRVRLREFVGRGAWQGPVRNMYGEKQTYIFTMDRGIGFGYLIFLGIT